MPKTLLIWVVLANFLLPSISQSCFQANESRCRDADFVPGSTHVGEGFDITTMERKVASVFDTSSWLKEDQSCTLCKNPYMGDQEQKLPVAIEEWKPTQRCNRKLSSSVYQSSEALLSASTSSIQNNWQSDLRIIRPNHQGSVILAGSHSKLAKYATDKTRADKFSFLIHSVSCAYYRYKVVSSPTLNPGLSKTLAALPEIYNETTKYQYYQLIDTFGTHYFTTVTLGGEAHTLTSVNQCQVMLHNGDVNDVKAYLDMKAVHTVGTAKNPQTENVPCKGLTILSNNFVDRETNVIGGKTQSVDLLCPSVGEENSFKEWVPTLPTHPDVISYSLKPLHQLLPVTQPIREQLRKAIRDYITQRALITKCTCKPGVNMNPNPVGPCTCRCYNLPGLAYNCCPAQRGHADITVTVIRGEDLYGDGWLRSGTDAFVKLMDNQQVNRGQTSTINNNDWPIWNERLFVETVDLTRFRMRIEVWDADRYSNERLGMCNVPLTYGERMHICELAYGRLYYRVQVKCVHGLTGPSCSDYIPL